MKIVQACYPILVQAVQVDDRLTNFFALASFRSSWPEAAKRRTDWIAKEYFFLHFLSPTMMLIFRSPCPFRIVVCKARTGRNAKKNASRSPSRFAFKTVLPTIHRAPNRGTTCPRVSYSDLSRQIVLSILSLRPLSAPINDWVQCQSVVHFRFHSHHRVPLAFIQEPRPTNNTAKHTSLNGIKFFHMRACEWHCGKTEQNGGRHRAAKEINMCVCEHIPGRRS